MVEFKDKVLFLRYRILISFDLCRAHAIFSRLSFYYSVEIICCLIFNTCISDSYILPLKASIERHGEEALGVDRDMLDKSKSGRFILSLEGNSNSLSSQSPGELNLGDVGQDSSPSTLRVSMSGGKVPVGAFVSIRSEIKASNRCRSNEEMFSTFGCTAALLKSSISIFS